MRRSSILSILVVVAGCSGDNSSPNNGTGADASSPDTSTSEPGADGSSDLDAGGPNEAAVSDSDAGGFDSGTDADAGVVVIADASADADASSDGGCPTSWFVAPAVDPSIAVPDGGGGVLMHAIGTGTQNYVCTTSTTDAGPPYVWTLVTPDAILSDCHAMTIGRHFASEAGAGFPEWQTNDGTYVIGQKHLPTFTPDGGSSSIPWLLLRAVDAGGQGTLSSTAYIERLNTDGGNAPAATCTSTTVGSTTDVPYSADYYFFGP